MPRFNSRHLVLAIVFALAAGCTKPTKGPDESSGSFFMVNKVSGGVTLNYESHSIWKIPQSATFIFKACLSGTAAHEHLYNQSFNVEVPGSREIFPVKTNMNSCFEWQETMPFNYLAGQSGWVTLERDIVGSGVYSGKKRIHIAVNPWAVNGSRKEASDPVIYLESGERGLPIANLYTAPQALHALDGSLQGASRLLVQNVKIKAIPEGEDGKWVALLVELTMDPVVQTRNSMGNVAYEDIRDGDFDLMMQVMASNVGAEMNQKVLLLGGDMHSVGKSINGKLKAEFRVRQERRANQGNLELVLQLRPRGLNAYKSLRPFNGVFRFGAGTVVKDESGTLANECVDNSDACDYEKVVSQTANFEALKGYVSDNERYIFSNLKLRFTSILPGETTTQRTVLYSAQTCITDNQTGRPLANTPMEIHYIKKDDGRVDMEPDFVRKSTDESGCLSWNGQAFHKYYEPEEFFEKIVSIRKGQKTVVGPDGKEAKVPSFERRLKFYLNPWDDKFTFGWDAREFTDDFFDEIRSRPKIQSRFFLGEYSYHTVRFLYNIDQFMALDVKKWVLMGLVPQVLRYSGIINARKMVEKLRDGIYLMKVAIQKSYLDPRDNSGWLLRNTPDLKAEMTRINGADLTQKEYITSNTVLVRVVDGVIIYPVELTMRDLRLMRVRSNMMIQLEMVDERLVQAYHILKKAGIQNQDLEEKLKEFQAKMPPGSTIDDTNRFLNGHEISPALQEAYKQRKVIASSPDMIAARRDLEARVTHIQDLVRESIARLKKRFESGGKNLGDLLNGKGELTGEPADIAPGTTINDGFELRKEQLNELRSVLKVNDFSTVALPKKEDIDLNLFAEKNSGLEKRSFVGPVIFLSNAYSDSVRATDNLDEANCVPRVKDKDGNWIQRKDAVRKTLEELELDYEAVHEVDKTESKLFANRQNNAYQYSEYFNSLTHLCYLNVDDLIEHEKAIRAKDLDRSRAASLKYNFVKSFGLDYISLTDEPLVRTAEGCKSDIDNCTQVTGESTLPVSILTNLVNDNLETGVHLSNTNFENVAKRFRGIEFRTEKTHWEPREYPELFFNHSLDSKAALCNLLANKAARSLRGEKLSSLSEAVIHEKIMNICSLDGGLIHDIKYRVEQTGKYAFLGGLNLNFNVGEGFSVGTSEGWSAGMELTDVVGAAGNLAGIGVLKSAGVALKPFNIKYGTGLNKSAGTSISESTYLVSQIAGFDVELTAYERCAWVGLSDQSFKHLAVSWGDSRWSRKFGLGTANFEDPRVVAAVRRGLFVCEGSTRTQNKPITVPESYFYFTQHFTEGDMLDQADLYNHPWLFSLRGMRDFTTFVEKIRAQEMVNFPEFLYHLAGTRAARPKGWALEHLGDAYRNVTPTFPGFYTVLDRGEPSIDVFALQQAANKKPALSKIDRDPLKEVNHAKILLEENAGRVKAPAR